MDLRTMVLPAGSLADRVGPVALRPRLASGLPLSASEVRRRGQHPSTPGSVYISRSADHAGQDGSQPCSVLLDFLLASWAPTRRLAPTTYPPRVPGTQRNRCSPTLGP